MIWSDFESVIGEVEEGDVVATLAAPRMARKRVMAYSLVIARISLPRRMADLTRRAKACWSVLLDLYESENVEGCRGTFESTIIRLHFEEELQPKHQVIASIC